MRPPFHLRLLGVGELHGDLELGGRVRVGVAGDHLRGAVRERERTQEWSGEQQQQQQRSSFYWLQNRSLEKHVEMLCSRGFRNRTCRTGMVLVHPEKRN